VASGDNGEGVKKKEGEEKKSRDLRRPRHEYLCLSKLLIVSSMDQEVRLRMLANRTKLRSLLADNDMAAIAALPDHVLIARENDTLLDIAQELTVTLLMSLLDSADLLEKESDLVESLFLGHLGKLGIHVSPLEVLAIGCILEISLGIRNSAIMQKLEPDLGMLLLIIGSLLKEFTNLDISVLLGLRSIIEIFGVSL
jgi:hypothetical protein